MELEKELENDRLMTKCRWSPFDGWRLKGWTIASIVNGNAVFEHGKAHNIRAREVSYNV